MENSSILVPTPLIASDPNRLGGTLCFAGTRVPVQTFFEYIEGGATLDEFLRSVPNVPHEHAIAVLKASRAAPIEASSATAIYQASAEEL